MLLYPYRADHPSPGAKGFQEPAAIVRDTGKYIGNQIYSKKLYAFAYLRIPAGGPQTNAY